MRPTHSDDVDIVLKLARMVHFINLPADKDIIAEKVARSRASFRAAAQGGNVSTAHSDRSATHSSPIFMFTLADSETNTPIGTSMIIAKMGVPEYPNVSFELSQRPLFSQDLQSGSTHTIAKLYLDESGKSEIGGLILGPTMRRHPERLGKQLSLIRFHYMGLRREQFAQDLLAEMMAPITPDGRNVFWEHLGRRFINLSYVDADKFCQYSREFMTSLLPPEDIYLTLLPPEARQGIAQVGRDTIPARKMLEALGMRYVGRIDPFDGGPHLECKIDDISLVRHTTRRSFTGTCGDAEADTPGFISIEGDGVNFRAVHGAYLLEGESGVRIPESFARALRATDGINLGLTPFDLSKKMSPEKVASTASTRKAPSPSAGSQPKPNPKPDPESAKA